MINDEQNIYQNLVYHKNTILLLHDAMWSSARQIPPYAKDSGSFFYGLMGHWLQLQKNIWRWTINEHNFAFNYNKYISIFISTMNICSTGPNSEYNIYVKCISESTHKKSLKLDPKVLLSKYN